MVFLPEMLGGWAGAAALMVLLWLVQIRTRNAGIVDFGWALGLGSLAVVAAIWGEGWPARRILVAVMGGLWGYRLALHLLRDRIAGKPEEGRYVHLREIWGSRLQTSFFLFFQAQALLAVILALPFFLSASIATAQWTGWDIAGLVLWAVGLGGESLADLQLSRFKAGRR